MHSFFYKSSMFRLVGHRVVAQQSSVEWVVFCLFRTPLSDLHLFLKFHGLPYMIPPNKRHPGFDDGKKTHSA